MDLLRSSFWVCLITFLAKSSLAYDPNPTDSLEAEAYLNEATDYMFTNTDSALMLSERGLEIAQQMDAPDLLNRIKMFQAICHAIARRSQRAVLLFQEACDGFTKAGRDSLAADCYINMGLAYYRSGELDQALESYLVAYDFYRGRDYQEGYGYLLNNIASIYKQQQKLSPAYDMYTEAYSVLLSIDDTLGQAAALHNIANVLVDQERYDEALERYQASEQLYLQLDRPEKMAALATTLGKIRYGLGQWEAAKENLEKAKRYFESHPNAGHAGEHYLFLGRIALQREKYQTAIQNLEDGLNFLKETDSGPAKAQLLEDLSTAYYGTGQSQTAYRYLREAKNLKDTLALRSRMVLEEKLQKQFEVAEKEFELEVAELELARRNRERALYLVLLGVALLLIGGVVYFLVQRNKTNRILSLKNDQISQALEDREMLLREIHHRVKNNLQVISSLLRLQSGNLSDSHVRDVLQESQHRVYSMSLIHQHTYSGESNFVAISARDYIEQLTYHLFSAYNTDPERIQLTTDIDPLLMDIDTAIPIGLILNELISNALKHAFPGNQAGSLKVGLKKQAAYLELKVSDNGIGMPNQMPLDGQNSSFGWQLIPLLAQKLEAEIATTNGKGTTAELQIKNYELA